MSDTVRNTVEEFQNGDRTAFAALVRHYQNLVTSTALAETGDFQRSEDIAQQTFLLAWQKQSELRDPDRFGGWLRGIARNLARNDRRLKTHANRRSMESVPEPSTEVTPSNSTSQFEQNELLWSTLEQIPVEYREPMILFYREEQSVRNVATMLNLSEAAVKQRLRRGREMLREEIRTMVEDLFYETRPSAAFSAGVMAAIPTSAVTGTTAAKTSILFGVKAMFTKLLAVASAGAIVGVLGGLVGVLGGIAGAWAGVRSGIKHATSEEEKQLHKRLFLELIVLSVVYFMVMLWVTFQFQSRGLAVTAVYVGILMTLIGRFSRRQQRLHKVHGQPAYVRDFKPQPVSRMAMRLNTLGAIAGITSWLVIYAFVRYSPIVASIALLGWLVHAVILWPRAPKETTPETHWKYNGLAVLEAAIIQATIILGATIAKANVARDAIQGIPFWMLGPVILAFGVGFYWFANGKISDESGVN